MSLRDLQIKEEYYTGEVDLVKTFYRPCLSVAKKYDRSVGFFRSTVFILVGPDLIDFIKRGGKIRLITSPCLTEDDIAAIASGYKQKNDVAQI